MLATVVQLERPVTVRELARHAGVSPQGALRIVNELAGAGLLITETAGRALMVSLNREHLAAEPLTALVGSRARLVERLRNELTAWSGLAGAWLFGSAARGDGGPNSDIDILLVATTSIDDNDWGGATARLISSVTTWTGNAVQLVEHTRRSFTQLVRRHNPLIDAIRIEGIPLTPKTATLLHRAA